MDPHVLSLTYIGGPTALLEYCGLRFLTDPTFDPAGTKYTTPVYTLTKLSGPSIAPAELGHIDIVLLSHDQHLDNLDNQGRELLKTAGKVITTADGAGRLGGNAVGLNYWHSMELPAPEDETIAVTATPARHGPEGGDRGPVNGFVLQRKGSQQGIYISGDTVLYDGIVDISRKFDIRVALLFMGAAVVPEVGKSHLTMTADEAVEAARLFMDALIVPLHCDGWAHFTENRPVIEKAFESAGMAGRLTWTGKEAITIPLD